MILPATFDPTQAFITDSGRVFQILAADGSFDDAATRALYKSMVMGTGSLVEPFDQFTAAGTVQAATQGTGSAIEILDTVRGKGTPTILGILPI